MCAPIRRCCLTIHSMLPDCPQVCQDLGTIFNRIEAKKRCYRAFLLSLTFVAALTAPTAVFGGVAYRSADATTYAACVSNIPPNASATSLDDGPIVRALRAIHSSTKPKLEFGSGSAANMGGVEDVIALSDKSQAREAWENFSATYPNFDHFYYPPSSRSSDNVVLRMLLDFWEALPPQCQTECASSDPFYQLCVRASWWPNFHAAIGNMLNMLAGSSLVAWCMYMLVKFVDNTCIGGGSTNWGHVTTQPPALVD